MICAPSALPDPANQPVGRQSSGELLVATRRFSAAASWAGVRRGDFHDTGDAGGGLQTAAPRSAAPDGSGFPGRLCHRSLVLPLDCRDDGVRPSAGQPDHTTLSRRRRTVDVVVETSTNKRSTDIVLDSTGLKFFGAGEWARAKHGETRRSWRKLHISVDPASSEIRTHELTGDDTADATMAGPLVAGSGGMIRRVFADGAYDGEPVTKAIREARPPNSPPEIIIPPRATSIPPPDTPHGGSEREHHAAEIASKGRMNWQKRQGYGLRALGETAMARVKRLNGGKLNARTFQSQQTEIAMQIDALNRSIRAAKPNTIRIR